MNVLSNRSGSDLLARDSSCCKRSFAERISFGLRFCLLEMRRGGTPREEMVSEEEFRMERRVEVEGMVIGITMGFSDERSRWKLLGSREWIVVNMTDEVGREYVDWTVP